MGPLIINETPYGEKGSYFMADETAKVNKNRSLLLVFLGSCWFFLEYVVGRGVVEET